MSFKNKSLLFFFVIASVMWVRYLSNHPAYNWDMLAYMGVVAEYESSSPIQIHKIVYETAAKELPQKVFQNLTAGEYRQRAYRDPDFFSQELKFYRIKPLYTFSIFFISQDRL